MTTNTRSIEAVKINQARLKRFKQNKPLLLMFFPVILFFLIFKYVPMAGIVIAFKDYNFVQGISGSPWVGSYYFKQLFSSPDTLTIIKNTFFLSVMNLIVGFPTPILLAILLNEIRMMWFKRSVQTLLYLPHFFSWVIVGGIVVTIFSQEKGIINNLLAIFHIETIPFLYKSVSWLSIFLGSGVWKETGFAAIIYLAALSGIDPALYEAASMDGANKWKQVWHVTLPGLLPTIIIIFILSVGRVMEVGFDQIYVLQNPVVADISQVISTYIYKFGFQGGQFSLTAAMGIFESVTGLVLVLVANWIARRFSMGLW